MPSATVSTYLHCIATSEHLFLDLRLCAIHLIASLLTSIVSVLLPQNLILKAVENIHTTQGRRKILHEGFFYVRQKNLAGDGFLTSANGEG